MDKQGPVSNVMDVRFSIAGGIPLNIPNALTISRILLIPVIVGFLVYGHYGYALITLIVAMITDALDGTIARLANQKTQFGAYLDPLADKLLLMTTFITCSLLSLVPVWSVIVVVSRDGLLQAVSGTNSRKIRGVKLDLIIKVGSREEDDSLKRN